MSETFRRDFLRASAGALALSGIASSSAAGQSTEGFTDWPTRGFDLQNTAHTPATPATRNLEIDWTVETDEVASILGNGQNRQSLPAIADGRVYVGGGYADSNSAVLRCVDLESGEVLWTYELTGPDGARTPRISTSPTVVNGTVYFAGMWKAVALDAETGDVRWKGDRPKVPKSSSADHVHGNPYGLFEAPPSVYDGVVYFPFVRGNYDSTPGGIRGFDAETGDLVFGMTFGRGTSAGLAIHDGSIYYTGYYEGLKKIDIENETVAWQDRLDPYRNADCGSPPGDVPYRPPVISPSGQTHRIHVFGQPFPNGVMNTYTWQADGKFVRRTTPQPEEKCGFNNANYWGVTEQSAVADERVMSAFIMGTENGTKGKVRGNIRPDTEWKKEYENSAPMGVSAASNVLVTTIKQRLVGLNAFTGEKLFEEQFGELDNWGSYEILGTPIPTDNRYLIHTWGGQLVCIKGDGPESSVTKPTTSTTTTATTRTSTDTPTTATQDPTKSTTQTTSTDVPGFGLGTGIAGVLGGAAALGHRFRRKPGNEE